MNGLPSHLQWLQPFGGLYEVLCGLATVSGMSLSSITLCGPLSKSTDAAVVPAGAWRFLTSIQYVYEYCFSLTLAPLLSPLIY